MKATRARNTHSNKTDLSPDQREDLLRDLKVRFETNMNRHKGLAWATVQARLDAHAERLWSLHEMERTGGEPDVVGHDKKTGHYCPANARRIGGNWLCSGRLGRFLPCRDLKIQNTNAGLPP
jgi:hypothetical protein